MLIYVPWLTRYYTPIVTFTTRRARLTLCYSVAVVIVLIMVLVARSFAAKSEDGVLLKVLINHVQTVALMSKGNHPFCFVFRIFLLTTVFLFLLVVLVLIAWLEPMNSVSSAANIVFLDVQLIPPECVFNVPFFDKVTLYMIIIPIIIVAPILIFVGGMSFVEFVMLLLFAFVCRCCSCYMF